MTTRNAIANGMALLDKQKPGWEHQIDLNRLNIASGSDCVLGQLYGGFNRGCDVLGILKTTSSQYGFDKYVSGWNTLNEGWREAIQKRRN